MGLFGNAKEATRKVPCPVHGSHDVRGIEIEVDGDNMPKEIQDLLRMASKPIMLPGGELRHAPSASRKPSALEEMILRRRHTEPTIAADPLIAKLVEAVDAWVLPAHRSPELQAGLREAIQHYLNGDTPDGLTRYSAFVLDDFGQKVLGTLKKEAARK